MKGDAIREYGGALFELAFEEGADDAVLSDIRGIMEFFTRGSELVRLLSSPSVPTQERVSCVQRVFAGVEPYLLNFLCLMTERGYARSIYGAFEKYISLYNEKHAITDAFAVSAVELSEEQKNALISSLSNRTGKKINLICRVDPSVIGGVSVSIDGEMFDGTVESKISQIRRKLSELSVN